MAKNVELVGDFFSPSGYSNHARQLVKALKDVCSLKIVDRKHDLETVVMDKDTILLMNSLARVEFGKPDVRIQFETPEFFDPVPGVYNIGFTQWETDRIPSTDKLNNARFNWVKQMNKMDAMWTSSRSAASAFIASGVRCQIHVVHGPVDTEMYRPDLPELPLYELNQRNGKFIPREERPAVVGCVGQWVYRKNINGFLETMFAGFDQDEVVILLKTYTDRMDGNQKNRCIDEIEGIRKRVGNPKAPRVVLVTEKLTDEAMARLYASMDFYVNPSRGEGYCLPLAQAMACGVVAVSTAATAPLDYIEDGVNGFLVDVSIDRAVSPTPHPWIDYNQRWAVMNQSHLEAIISDCLSMGGGDLKKIADAGRRTMQQSHSILANKERLPFFL